MTGGKYTDWTMVLSLNKKYQELAGTMLLLLARLPKRMRSSMNIITALGGEIPVLERRVDAQATVNGEPFYAEFTTTERASKNIKKWVNMPIPVDVVIYRFSYTSNVKIKADLELVSIQGNVKVWVLNVEMPDVDI
jgi:hypothetical protein